MRIKPTGFNVLNTGANNDVHELRIDVRAPDRRVDGEAVLQAVEAFDEVAKSASKAFAIAGLSLAASNGDCVEIVRPDGTIIRIGCEPVITASGN